MQRRRRKSKNVEKKKVRHSKEDSLKESELKELIDIAKNNFDRVIITLAGYQGMRSSEIAHMRKSWINYQDKTIEIPEEQDCECGECISKAKKKARLDEIEESKVDKIKKTAWKPKTTSGIRMMPIRERAYKYIEDYFESEDDIGCSRQTIFNHIKSLARKSSITKKIYPHSLRSTGATLWGQTGISATSLCAIMGWSDIETAYNYVKADMESAVREARWRDREGR